MAQARLRAHRLGGVQRRRRCSGVPCLTVRTTTETTGDGERGDQPPVDPTTSGRPDGRRDRAERFAEPRRDRFRVALSCGTGKPPDGSSRASPTGSKPQGMRRLPRRVDSSRPAGVVCGLCRRRCRRREFLCPARRMAILSSPGWTSVTGSDASRCRHEVRARRGYAGSRRGFVRGAGCRGRQRRTSNRPPT